MSVEQFSYTREQAALMTGLSLDTIRRAINKTSADDRFPPPLKAKRAGRRIVIDADELRQWIKTLPDA